jgi:hypothetical protein
MFSRALMESFKQSARLAHWVDALDFWDQRGLVLRFKKESGAVGLHLPPVSRRPAVGADRGG